MGWKEEEEEEEKDEKKKRRGEEMVEGRWRGVCRSQTDTAVDGPQMHAPGMRKISGWTALYPHDDSLGGPGR